jgi:hypothetical protein
MSEVQVNEKQSSIEVSQNAKGEYAFKVKIYFDSDATNPKAINKVIQETMNDLDRKFKPKRQAVKR